MKVKMYLVDLTPEFIIAYLKKGGKVYKDNSSEWWEYIDGMLCCGINGRIDLINPPLYINEDDKYIEIEKEELK